jgi:hypothetical protein
LTHTLFFAVLLGTGGPASSGAPEDVPVQKPTTTPPEAAPEGDPAEEEPDTDAPAQDVPLDVVELGPGEGAAESPGADDEAPDVGEPGDADPIVDLDPDGDGRFDEPPEWGPFYEPAPASDLTYANEPRRPYPLFSVGRGAFCFLEDAQCSAALIADADIGIGINSLGGSRSLDVPYTQFRARGGFTVRPLSLAQGRWRAWGLGVVGSWSIGSASLVAGGDADDPFEDVDETGPLESWRVAAINQVWLAQKRNALHVDFTLGAVNSTVMQFPGRFWGTHAELALGWAGWAAIFASADFLDQDTRAVVGARVHAIPAAPVVLLVILGMVAGGASL